MAGRFPGLCTLELQRDMDGQVIRKPLAMWKLCSASEPEIRDRSCIWFFKQESESTSCISKIYPVHGGLKLAANPSLVLEAPWWGGDSRRLYCGGGRYLRLRMSTDTLKHSRPQASPCIKRVHARDPCLTPTGTGCAQPPRGAGLLSRLQPAPPALLSGSLGRRNDAIGTTGTEAIQPQPGRKWAGAVPQGVLCRSRRNHSFPTVWSGLTQLTLSPHPGLLRTHL